MAWTITRTDDTIRLDLLTNLDKQGRPGSHRVFEYPLDSTDDGLFTVDGEIRADSVLSTEVRRRVREQLAAENAPAAAEVDDDVVIASGDRL